MNPRLEEQLIKKVCRHAKCMKVFRAFPSGSKYCSTECARKDGEEVTTEWKGMNNSLYAESRAAARERKESAQGLSADMPRTQSTESDASQGVGQQIERQNKESETVPIRPVTTIETRPILTSERRSGPETTEQGIMPKIESGSKKTLPISSEKSASEETVPTPLESSDALPATLSQEGLTSMRLLHKSANRLMRLMEECVTDSDLERSSEGNGGVDNYRIDQAVRAANSLAGTIRTQANLLKALAVLKRE